VYLIKKSIEFFLIIEGIYGNTGDIVPLKEVMKLKQSYPFRIILDESWSFGVLGKTGKGVTEHFNVPVTDVEIIVASTGNAIGSVGGFAVGQDEICSHQRLNCTGYVFSCASPPFTSAAASTALQLLSKGGVKPLELRPKTKRMHERLTAMLASSGAHKGRTSQGIGDIFENTSDVESPYIHLRLKIKYEDRDEVQALLEKVVDLCFEKGVIIATATYSAREIFRPAPGLKISVPLQITNDEIDKAVDVLRTSIMEVFLQ